EREIDALLNTPDRDFYINNHRHRMTFDYRMREHLRRSHMGRAWLSTSRPPIEREQIEILWTDVLFEVNNSEYEYHTKAADETIFCIGTLSSSLWFLSVFTEENWSPNADPRHVVEFFSSFESLLLNSVNLTGCQRKSV